MALPLPLEQLQQPDMAIPALGGADNDSVVPPPPPNGMILTPLVGGAGAGAGASRVWHVQPVTKFQKQLL